MSGGYGGGMLFDVGDSLQAGLRSAQTQLAKAADAVARANAGQPGATDAAMAQTAQATLFDEALLSAVRARLAEIKAVTK
jgi:hypothetical protein